LLEVNRFLTELARLYEEGKKGGKAVTLSMKRTDLRGKRKKKKTGSGASDGDEKCFCLVRAVHGKKKISTLVSSKDQTYFQNACNTICKAHIDSLKRKDRSRRKAASAASAKKTNR